MRGRKTLLVFWNPKCGFCQAMVDDLKAWEADPPERAPKLVVVSTGTVEENRALGLRSTVVLDDGFRAASAFGASGTPIAVLIDERGKIASDLAVGAPAVLALAGVQHDGSAPAPVPPAPTIGEPAPEVRLPDLAGNTVELAGFKGRRTLVLFWNPACGFCDTMLDDLRAWDANRRDGDPSLVVISRGTAEENQAMGLRSPVLLDQDWSATRAFGANGTPMAILVDEDGRVASELGGGAPAVLELAMGRGPAEPAIA
jgi:thiol-disulfide isomerase/thioredoxin